MKVKRVLAALLCLMMIVCNLPMMAMAAPTAKEFDAAGSVLGAASILPVSSLEFDFAGAGTAFALPEGAGTATGTTYEADGLTFGDTQGVWKYYPATKRCPFSYGPVIYFKAKVAEGGSLIAQAYFPADKHYRMFYTITSEGADATGATGVTVHDENFKPGTDYVEYLMLKDANNGNAQILFAKGGTATEWTKIMTATTWREGSNATGLSFSGTKTVIPYMAVVELSDTKQDNIGFIEEIMGGKVASSYAFDFDSEFDETYWKRDGSLTSPEGIVYSDENGLDMTGGETAFTWNYYAYSGWSPFSSQPARGSYVPQAVYFMAKGGVNVKFRGPGNDGRFYLDLADNASIGTGGGTATYDNPISTDGGWMEYLVVPKAESTTAGYSLYVKGENATNGKWVKRAEADGWKSGGGPTTGLNLYGNSGMVKSIRTYQLGVNESSAMASDNTCMWFFDDMNKTVSYGNLTDTGAVYRDGYANFPATTDTGRLKYELTNATIPVGGYVEFKTRSNGPQFFVVGDGEKGVSFTINKDYGEVSNKGAYVADASNTWRIYRVVRTAQGYNAYSKAEGDNAWLLMNENVNSNVTINGITLSFAPHADGSSVGSGQLDYVKIYGPIPEDDVMLIDGGGTNVIGENVVPTHLGSISAVIKPDVHKNRTFFFAVYGEKGNAIDVVKQEIPAGKESTIVLCNALKNSSRIRKIKGFLWDGLNGVKPIGDPIELKGNAASWEDDWTFGGKARADGNKIYLTSTSNAEAYAEYETSIGNQFDISWEMEVDAFSGQENIQIYTGVNKVLLSVAKGWYHLQ